jgi:hypothetical protein
MQPQVWPPPSANVNIETENKINSEMNVGENSLPFTTQGQFSHQFNQVLNCGPIAYTSKSGGSSPKKQVKRIASKS